jgi:hypothetical protein
LAARWLVEADCFDRIAEYSSISEGAADLRLSLIISTYSISLESAVVPRPVHERIKESIRWLQPYKQPCNLIVCFTRLSLLIATTGLAGQTSSCYRWPVPWTGGMWATDILFGAITSGVNLPTHIAVNVILGLAFSSLLALLAASVATKPWLVPHVLVLLVLAAGLWISINWFISQTGLVDSSEQRKQLFGEAGTEDKGEGATGEGDTSQATTGAAGTAEPKKEL